MKEMIRLGKKLIGGLLAVALVIALMPDMGLKAYADDPVSYNLWVGEDAVTSAKTSGIGNTGGKGTWTYDNSTHTLTLDNFEYTGDGSIGYNDNYSAIIYYSGVDDLTINVVGENTLVKTADTSSIFGILIWESNVLIKSDDGTGVLNVKTPSNTGSQSIPIKTWSKGISFDNVIVNASTEKTSSYGYALEGDYRCNPDDNTCRC